ncbi:Uncharacterised protein (plasmid) [Legionella adelaidensis]|uniref:Uncharacterized protein n=1 Tax=Legionella adelaidensis TaxID=45056 RepID=A0A0W0R0R8_9GAMM|nr:hypothetical protein [Legionella adelaidensis]KTC64703.1 hypothetical protein Lade_1997 [Legionella adelaidensis]VEH86177.1 Uncharacterised protein [Legionella adelaidensis]
MAIPLPIIISNHISEFYEKYKEVFSPELRRAEIDTLLANKAFNDEKSAGSLGVSQYSQAQEEYLKNASLVLDHLCSQGIVTLENFLATNDPGLKVIFNFYRDENIAKLQCLMEYLTGGKRGIAIGSDHALYLRVALFASFLEGLVYAIEATIPQPSQPSEQIPLVKRDAPDFLMQKLHKRLSRPLGNLIQQCKQFEAQHPSLTAPFHFSEWNLVSYNDDSFLAVIQKKLAEAKDTARAANRELGITRGSGLAFCLY